MKPNNLILFGFALLGPTYIDFFRQPPVGDFMALLLGQKNQKFTSALRTKRKKPLPSRQCKIETKMRRIGRFSLFI